MKRSRNLIIKQRFGAFLEEISFDKDLSFLTYPCYFMLRRFFMAVMLVVFQKFLSMQIFLKAMSVVTALILIGEANYFETPFKQQKEFSNEILLMIMLYNMICFSPFVPDIEARFRMGFFCCVVEALALALSILFIIRESLKSIILKLRIWFAKSEKRKLRIKYLRARAKGNVMRRRRNRRKAKRKQINDYGFELDEKR
jgi:hypothetical protein